MTDQHEPTNPLPAEVEEQLFDIFFARAEADRDTLVTELAQRNKEHTGTIRALAKKLHAGAGVFDGIDLPGEIVLPESIGDYKILSQLGEGGFGVVFLGEQVTPIKRRVAIKCLLPGMDSRRVLARFDAERQALAMMSHPNIAKVFDARSDEEQRPYFVMEYVPGSPITTYCDEQRLSTNERLDLFSTVCAAVQHAHQKGIIHRDLKPSNVLVMEEDGKPVVKVIDFGIAKAIYQPLTMKTLHTEVGRMVGTPEYMSPEQTSPSPLDVDTRTDIYSLGVMLYELLAGSLPFDGFELRKAGFAEMHRVIRQVEPIRPSQRVTKTDDTGEAVASRRQTSAVGLVDQLKGDLDWIVLRALEKERARRYDTAEAMAADIARHLNHLPVHARPPELLYVWGKYLRRHRTQVAAALLVFVALSIGLIASYGFYRDSQASLVQAATNLEIADGHLARFDRLADVLLLDELNREAKTLWPEIPEKVAPMQSWLKRAEPLAARVADHEKTIATLTADTGSGRYLREALTRFLADLRTFVQPETGLFAGVTARCEFAQRVRKLSIEDHAKAWQDCIASIATDRRFAGFQLVPQMGLIPLGADKATGLWEFAHLRSGKPAHRTHAGELLRGISSGLVLVLIPGGKFTMGAQKNDANDANYSVQAQPTERPVHEVPLGPFFLSKFEMTQAQWLRFTGENPSSYQPGDDQPAFKTVRLDHPVESISFHAASQTMSRLGLAVPTEAQWEYACRAGTSTPWHTGLGPRSLQGFANIQDEGTIEYYPKGRAFEAGIDDGHAVHAPVGSFKPNRFGLFDMHGNVSEWTRDWYKYYENPTDPDDGLRSGELGKREVVLTRGGSFASTANGSRSGYRSAQKPSGPGWSLGVRPARKIEPRAESSEAATAETPK